MSSRFLTPVISSAHKICRTTFLTSITVDFGKRMSVPLARAMATDSEYFLTIDNMNPYVKIMEYAIQGPLVMRANEIVKELANGAEKPFTEVMKANIGDCHAMGQVPLTFMRQVLALVTYTKLLNDPSFPDDAKSRAREILKGCVGGSVGSYTDSVGIEMIRKHVACYIENRDECVPCDYQNIVLTAGASDGIKNLMKLMLCDVDGKKPGVMIPIPQYPLYSATLAEFNMHQIGYYLDESNNWSLSLDELERSINEAKKDCFPRIIVIINPGNPTGQVLSKQNIGEIIKFSHKNKLFIFADEVYQHNVYEEGSKFHSFKKVMNLMGEPYCNMELASFMSCSKGYMGECGLRGGYVEVVNMCPEVKAMYLKSISAMLCPTVLGQAATYVVVNPPQPGEPSYEQFMNEKNCILESLKIREYYWTDKHQEKCHLRILPILVFSKVGNLVNDLRMIQQLLFRNTRSVILGAYPIFKVRAKMVADAFHSFEGFSCNPVQGAMYAFPQITLPPKAIEAAKEANQQPDVFYAFQLLEDTGICIVPGSGFGQQPGTYHFRTTILQQPEVLEHMLEKFRVFHETFYKKYA